jgi:hypothetical protein
MDRRCEKAPALSKESDAPVQARGQERQARMIHPDRQGVYDALDGLPEAVFAALLYAMSGVNKVLALTVMDNPAPNATLDRAIRPFLAKLE